MTTTDTCFDNPLTGKPEDYLWCGTFTVPGGSRLDRYYGTYGIDSGGRLAGSVTPPWNRLYLYYRVLDEFSCIAVQLIALGVFDAWRTLWGEALQCAISQAATVISCATLTAPAIISCARFV